jgi:hypothetical protein
VVKWWVGVGAPARQRRRDPERVTGVPDIDQTAPPSWPPANENQTPKKSPTRRPCLFNGRTTAKVQCERSARLIFDHESLPAPLPTTTDSRNYSGARYIRFSGIRPPLEPLD